MPPIVAPTIEKKHEIFRLGDTPARVHYCVESRSQTVLSIEPEADNNRVATVSRAQFLDVSTGQTCKLPYHCQTTARWVMAGETPTIDFCKAFVNRQGAANVPVFNLRQDSANLMDSVKNLDCVVQSNPSRVPSFRPESKEASEVEDSEDEDILQGVT